MKRRLFVELRYWHGAGVFLGVKLKAECCNWKTRIIINLITVSAKEAIFSPIQVKREN